MTLAKPRKAPKRRGHRDPVTPATYRYVVHRDRGCVGPRVLVTGACAGPIEMDHVDNGGVGKRGPSTPSNLVLLCQAHHMEKTANARLWRPVLRDYIERMEG